MIQKEWNDDVETMNTSTSNKDSHENIGKNNFSYIISTPTKL